MMKKLDTLVKALRCLASNDGFGDCYMEHYNAKSDGERMSCGKRPGTLQCPYHQNTYETCFEDGQCGEWLNEIADIMELITKDSIKREALEKLEYYKKLEEQGLLLELPCRHGEMLYRIEGAPGSYSIGEWKLNAGNAILMSKNLNKTVFRAEEEAQAVLEQLRERG